MTDRPARIVDAHVHLWDPALADWYPWLVGQRDLGMGDITAMARRFDLDAYRSESAGWAVTDLVNVCAAMGHHGVDETLDLERRASEDGQPAAIIGALPVRASIAEAVADLDRQAAASRFVGVRPQGWAEGPLVPAELLRELADRGLVFELMAHPDQLAGAAAGVAASRADDLTVVVEHSGWPRVDTAEERARWENGMRAWAELGDRVVCKLSGLAMPLGTIDAGAFRPWLEPLIERFGPDRCLFASNFPVDGLHGTLDELWSAYDELTRGLDDDARDALFATTAERTYRLET